MNSLASFASRPNCLMIYFILNLKFEVPDVPPKGENEFANVHVHLFLSSPEQLLHNEFAKLKYVENFFSYNSDVYAQIPLVRSPRSS